MSRFKAVAAPWQGGWAMVTGASSGIGAELARALAADGANLILTARRADRLEALAAELRASFAVSVEAIAQDLADPEAPDRLHAFAHGLAINVDVLINNAGVLRHGAFHEDKLEPQLAMLRVHCEAPVRLTHLFLPDMVTRGTGHVLMVATTLLAPAPYLALYAATKGFELLFAEGLGEEVARYGVKVSTLCPGPTRSEMIHVSSGQEDQLQDTRQVALRALRGLARGKPCIRPSVSARMMAVLPRLLPRSTVSGALERAYRPM